MKTMCAFPDAERALAERRIEDALRLLDAAEACGHAPNECAGERWFCYMLLGRFEDAWKESERIDARGSDDPIALWDGNPFADKRVIVRCLHGYGDAIQFIRFGRFLKPEARRIIVQTHPQLISLFQQLPWADSVISWDCEDRGSWDQQIEVMELPRAFRTTLQTIPDEVPYLHVPRSRMEHSRIAPRNGLSLRVGIQWASSRWDATRDVPFDKLASLLSSSSCEFYSFQRGEARAALLDAAGFAITDVSGDSSDITEAAADLMRIDLLITVDTMLAHLAGALGKPVWMLLPYAADWRWMLSRRDTPWYPTMRLFRQSSPGDWNSALHDIKSELEVFIADGSKSISAAQQ
jgi:hypothetical protein